MADKTAQAPNEDQTDIAKRAMELKEGSPPASHPASEPTGNEGMAPNPNDDIAPSGAFDAEGQRPVLERSRKVR